MVLGSAWVVTFWEILYIHTAIQLKGGLVREDDPEDEQAKERQLRELYTMLAALDALLGAASTNAIQACHVRQLLQPMIKSLDRATD